MGMPPNELTCFGGASHRPISCISAPVPRSASVIDFTAVSAPPASRLSWSGHTGLLGEHGTDLPPTGLLKEGKSSHLVHLLNRFPKVDRLNLRPCGPQLQRCSQVGGLSTCCRGRKPQCFLCLHMSHICSENVCIILPSVASVFM